MALRTEAPSTGSQREPSRLEQNTNQRLTGHSHSPHQRDGRTPAQSTHIPVPRFTSYSQGWMNALILAATQEKLAQAGTGKLKMRGPLNECVCVFSMCVCHLCFQWASADILWVDDGKQAANLEQNRSLWDWSVTAMLVSALRSASRVQNTNTNCPHNTGLLSDRRER